MSGRSIASAGACAVVIALVVLVAPPLAGQSAAKKTPWGDPDLQGVYTFSTLTPLQRPDALAGKVALTEAELAEIGRAHV